MRLRRASACCLSATCVLALALAILVTEAPRARAQAEPPQAPVSGSAANESQSAGNAGSGQSPAPAAPDAAAQAQPTAPPSAEGPVSPPAAASSDPAQPPAAVPQQPQPGTAAEQSSPGLAAPSPPEGTTANTTGGADTPPDASAAAIPPAGAKSKDLPRDLSPWGMFQAADIVVKAVMIGLALASFVTWTVWLAKAIELHAAKRRLRRAIAEIRSAQSLGDVVERFVQAKGTGAFLVREAAEEVLTSAPALDHGDGQGIKERVTSRLVRAEAAAGRRMTLGTGVLATIGATAPFVGLFGTVWGIMNAFIGISEAQTTNLAVVAPGIAEALLATAIGLVAAIPAVIIYNVFARSIAGYRLLLADASAGIERLVSRDLDFRRLPQGTAPALVRARAAE